MRFDICIVLAIIALGLVPTNDAFFSSLIERVKQNWRASWKQMRDDNLQPRLVSYLPMPGMPTFAQVWMPLMSL